MPHIERQPVKVAHRRRALALTISAFLVVVVAGSTVAALELSSSEATAGAKGLKKTARSHYRPIEIEGNQAFPMETMIDVRQHADAIALVTPIQEEELSDQSVIQAGEGLLGRRITVRIDQTLWKRNGAPTLPNEVVTSGGSWSYDHGTREPFIIVGDVGKQSLFIFGHNDNTLDTDGYEWMQEGALSVPMINGKTPGVIEGGAVAPVAASGFGGDASVEANETAASCADRLAEGARERKPAVGRAEGEGRASEYASDRVERDGVVAVSEGAYEAGLLRAA